MFTMNECPDVAIVGAGFAGLAAAYELVAHGISVELFEATDRVGGRAQTEHGAAELGPEFVHGCPDVTLDLVQKAGIELEPVATAHSMWRDGTLVEVKDTWVRFGKLLEPAVEAAQAHRPDESACDYRARAHFTPEDASLFTMLVEGFYAAFTDDIGIDGIAEDAGGVTAEDAAQQSRPRGGYGRLTAWLAAQLVRAGVPMRFDHVVNSIDYRSDRVRIDHSHGSSLATRAIVTLPLGVLQANRVRFEPELGEHAALLNRFAMGQVVKVVLCLREPLWRHYGARDLQFLHRDDTAFPTFWMRSAEGYHMVTGWAGGPRALALRDAPLDALVERVVDGLSSSLAMPPARLADAIMHAHYHDYDNDPFAYGAYSYTRVGGLGAAHRLTRPIADKLFLAGEVTDQEYEGSVAGALMSGQRAARQIVETLATARAVAAGAAIRAARFDHERR
jgi:monoamine oxidase